MAVSCLLLEFVGVVVLGYDVLLLAFWCWFYFAFCLVVLVCLRWWFVIWVCGIAIQFGYSWLVWQWLVCERWLRAWCLVWFCVLGLCTGWGCSLWLGLVGCGCCAGC